MFCNLMKKIRKNINFLRYKRLFEIWVKKNNWKFDWKISIFYRNSLLVIKKDREVDFLAIWRHFVRDFFLLDVFSTLIGLYMWHWRTIRDELQIPSISLQVQKFLSTFFVEIFIGQRICVRSYNQPPPPVNRSHSIKSALK